MRIKYGPQLVLRVEKQMVSKLMMMNLSDVRARLRLKAAAWARLLTAQAFETLGPSPSHG
jgi:hypothetical protein